MLSYTLCSGCLYSVSLPNGAVSGYMIVAYLGHILTCCYYTRFFVRKMWYINSVPKSARRLSVCPSRYL